MVSAEFTHYEMYALIGKNVHVALPTSCGNWSEKTLI